MILLVAATEMEAAPLLEKAGQESNRWGVFICGVGVVESAVRLSRYLAGNAGSVDCVLNVGVGGAYLQPPPGSTPALLSLCLATAEVLGDLGISIRNRIEPLPEELTGLPGFDLGNAYREKTVDILRKNGEPFEEGVFITVASASGTQERGDFLQKRWNGLCENMEGAALARVCREYDVPMVELRVISNLVEDRNPAAWKLAEACDVLGRSGATVLKELV